METFLFLCYTFNLVPENLRLKEGWIKEKKKILRLQFYLTENLTNQKDRGIKIRVLISMPLLLIQLTGICSELLHFSGFL